MKNGIRGIVLKNKIKTIFCMLFILFLLFCMLIRGSDALHYASIGLTIWFNKMIPTLFPFMMLSGILIKTGYSVKLAKLCYPFIGNLFQLSYDCVYIIIMGFLCGFPMGGAVIAQSLKAKRISQQEANLLLAFTNNIGPVYFFSFICVNCPLKSILFPALVMYLVPFLYGLLLRYTKYHFIPFSKQMEKNIYEKKETIFQAMDDSITSGIENITKLGGYMILFNLFNLIFAFPLFAISDLYRGLIACMLEISGGVIMLTQYPVYFPFIYIMLPIGGLSCIAQTYSITGALSLNMKEYLIHKLIQGIITFLLYAFFLFSFFDDSQNKKNIKNKK